MNIYVAHASSFNYPQDLYQPIQQSTLAKSHNFIFPHLTSEIPVSSKPAMQEGEIDLIIAEVTHASTGLGIELGWADAYGIPIIGMHKAGTRVSDSLKIIINQFISYASNTDLIGKLSLQLKAID